MPLRRSLSWSSALVGIKSDRTRLPAGMLAMRGLIEANARARKTPLVTATGAYDRSAIMTMAVEAAKAEQVRTGQPWQACMSIALKAAWSAAQFARYRATH